MVGVRARERSSRAEWLLAGLCALLGAVCILCLFYYWFAIADRYVVFLYYHDMGPSVPDTSPFSPETGSRYWMAGLVACGVVMVLYVGANGLLGRLLERYEPPAWWQVWLASAVPLAAGIPAITMTINRPALPLPNAAQVTLATLAGLALALLPGRRAARRPGELFWLAIEGSALMLLLVNGAKLDYVARWLREGRTVYVLLMGSGMIGGLVMLLVALGLHLWRRGVVPRAVEVFASGLVVSYLVLPLVHHVGFTDGYYYISSASNFFAGSGGWQVVAWLIAAAVAFAAERLGRHVIAKWAGESSRRRLARLAGGETSE